MCIRDRSSNTDRLAKQPKFHSILQKGIIHTMPGYEGNNAVAVCGISRLEFEAVIADFRLEKYEVFHAFLQRIAASKKTAIPAMKKIPMVFASCPPPWPWPNPTITSREFPQWKNPPSRGWNG